VRREEDEPGVEAKDAAVDVRLPSKHAGVVDEVSSRKVLGSVPRQTSSAGIVKGVGDDSTRLVKVELDFRVDGVDPVLGRLNLGRRLGSAVDDRRWRL